MTPISRSATVRPVHLPLAEAMAATMADLADADAARVVGVLRGAGLLLHQLLGIGEGAGVCCFASPCLAMVRVMMDSPVRRSPSSGSNGLMISMLILTPEPTPVALIQAPQARPTPQRG